jgi:3-hydroxy-9,10-secoandrosta-1,3,5(10)-triene-9,17-dione monooxygenase
MTITSTQHAMTDKELTTGASQLQAMLRENAFAGDVMRRLPDDAIKGLTDAGFFRMLKPAQYGGYSVKFRTVLQVIEILGAANGAAAWLVAVASGANALVGCGPQRVQSEVFSSPDARIAGGLHPGTALRVDGGLSVNGSWPFSSGAPHADWVGLGVAVRDPDAGDAEPYLCLVPAQDLELRDTWHTVGMRGTASHTFVAEQIYVPEHRVISLHAVMNGDVSGGEQGQGLALAVIGGVLMLGALVGLGRAAVDFVVDKAPSKSIQGTPYARQSDSVGVQVQLAEATLKLQTARLHAYDLADALDSGAITGGEAAYPRRAQARAQCGYAVQQILASMQILMNIHGAGGFADSSPLQQYWRDANTAARHASFNAFVGYEIFGKSLLGLAERISSFV